MSPLQCNKGKKINKNKQHEVKHKGNIILILQKISHNNINNIK